MRLLLLTALTMIAFAANSVLNRTALEGGDIDALSFAALRVTAGVVVLMLLVLMRHDTGKIRGAFDLFATIGLLAYMLGFSFAYNSLDTGLGALILFGGVQITMFAGAVLFGKKPVVGQWIGAAIAFSGLVYLLAPSDVAPSPFGMGVMAIAAVGWGVYSLQGAKATDPLVATCANFSAALPIVLVAWLFVTNSAIGPYGAALAIVSGAVTSALGYALWYQVLPQLQTATAAVAQLTVPIIAALGGFVVLSEPVTMTFIVASVLVLGGIGISVWAANRG